MINQNPDNSRHGEISDDVLNQGLEQIRAGSLRLASDSTEVADPSTPQGGFASHEPTPDEVWEYMAANRNREFDHTTAQGRRMFELFEIANKERNQFTFDAVKQMVNTIARVPANLVTSLAGNATEPLKVAVSGVDAVARDIRDLYGILAQSEDPASPLFRFKSYLSGNGSVEERIKQFNEARWFNNKSQDLENGENVTVLEDFLPADKRDFVRSLVDPKLAQALSYIGLDLPHVLMSPLRARRALGTAVHAYKDPAVIANALSETAKPMREALDLAAQRGKNFSGRVIGGAMSGVADVVATPFRAIEEKIKNASSAVAETSGANVNVLKNAASTVLADSGEKVVGNFGLSPIRSTLFSFGVKPLAEYASVLGSEIVDAAQGVSAIKPEFMGKGMLERLATKNGSRIPLSTEALAVAKFTNVVVGWPASMAIPVLKRAVGDAAVMGTLGYLNARGEGAAGGVGVGFAWGGISGSLRHVHNVYQHSQSQRYMIDNFDKAQINQIASVAPENARNYSYVTSVIDKIGDDRVSATARAFMSMLHSTDATTQFRFADINELYSEFGVDGVIPELDGGDASKLSHVDRSLGAEFRVQKDGQSKKVVWINKSRAVPETIGHEIAHRILNHVLSMDGDSHALVQQFLGDAKDAGVLSDSAIAHLVADYTATQYGINKKKMLPALVKHYETELASLRQKIEAKTISWSQLTKNEYGEMVPEPMAENSFSGDSMTLPFGKILHEVFAYSVSNQLLTKGSDFFMRSPEATSLRAHFENLYTLMNQRTIAKAEEAGVIIQHVMDNAVNQNSVAFQTYMWEDGQYRRFEMLDSWAENIMRKAMRNGDVNASLLSPERAKAYFESTGKIRFSNVINAGRVMKDKKEVDQLITENAEQMVKIWEALPDNERPKFTKDQGGNITVDLTNVSKPAWDAITGRINMTKAEIDELKGICEVIRDNRSGKPVFNTFTGQYLGRTHQVELKGLVKRLTGKDVPVTYRRFSPFAAELKFDKFDENGNPIRNPKGHVTLHVVDVAVLDRRRQKMWSRADVRAIFTDFGHFTRTFTTYMHNLSQATGIKLPSEKLFEKEFGSQAGKVRDLMYETFGGRKRVDESYINVPSDGYTGNKDGPNYPFHSLRFELLANMERQTRVFAETFGIGLGNLPYNHIEAYEGVRRNLMVGGFRPHELDNDRKFWSNGAGYEVRGDAGRFRLFTPYGNSVGVFKTPEKAFASADKHAKKLDPADFTPTSGNDGVTSDENLDIMPTMAGSLNGSANFMVSGGKIVHMDVQKSMNKELVKFKALVKNFDFRNPLTKNSVTLPALDQTTLSKLGAPYITLRDFCGTSAESNGHVLKKYPELGNILIYCSGGSFVNGDIDVQLSSGRQAFDAVGISERLANHKNFEEIIQSELMPHIQSWIDLKEGNLSARLFAFNFTGKLLESELVGVQEVGKIQNAYNAYKSSGNPNATISDFLEAQAEKFTTDFVNDYISGSVRGGKPSTRIAPSFINQSDFIQPLWADSASQQDPSSIAAIPSSKRSKKSNWAKEDSTGNLLYELTHKQVQDVNDHFLKIYRSFVGNTPTSYTVNIMGRFVWLVDKGLVNNPRIQQIRAELNAKYPQGGEHFIYYMNTALQDSKGLLHAMSKKPDRQVQMGGRTDYDAIESNRYAKNIGIADNPTPLTSREFTYIDENGKAVSGAFDGEPRVDFQTALIEEGLGNYVMLHMGLGFGRNMTQKSELVVQHNRFIPIQIKGNQGTSNFISPTSDMKGLKGSVQELLGSFPNLNGEQIMSVNMSMAMLRQSPFLEYDFASKSFGATGSLHEAYNSGVHVDMLQQIAKELIPNLTEQDMAQLGTASGAEKFVRLTYDLKQDGKAYFARQIGMAVQQILLGDEVIKGDPNRVSQVASQFGTESGQNYIKDHLSDPNVLGRTMVNAGYAKLMKTAILADSNVLKRSFEQSRRTKPLAKLMSEIKRFNTNTFDVMGVNINEKRPRYVGGFGQKPAALGPNWMLGGYQNSTNARMQEMIDLGMARQIRTDGGRIYHAFEFTDADSQLKLESVRGELHLLPLLGGYGLDDTATEGLDKVADRFFKEYLQARATNDRASMNQIVSRLSYIKLSDLLDHKLLFHFYPNLKNVMVGFSTGYDASYSPSLNKITIGIDRMIGDEVNKRTDSYKIPTSIFEDTPDRGTRSLLLHEIQHSIQRVEGWSDAYSVNNLEDFRVGAIRFLVGEIMGNKEAVGISRDVLSNKDLDFLEKYFGPDAKLGTKTPLDVLNAVHRLVDSPMHKQIKEFALPALLRVVGEMTLAISDAYGEMPETHPERKRAEALVRDLENIHRKVNQYNQMVKDGTASHGDVYVAITKHGGIIDAISDMQSRAYSLGDSPIAKALFADISYANRYLTESLSLLHQNESLKTLTAGDTNGQMLALRNIADTLSDMHYHGMRTEIEANVTERRRNMTQDELNKTGLSPSGERISGIEGFEGPLDIGTGENSLRKIGMAIAQKKDIRSLMFGQNANLMVGGLGLGLNAFDPARQQGMTDSLRVLETLGRLATVSHVVSTINDDLNSLKIYGFTSRGWEVDAETGKVSLVYKKGTMRSPTPFETEDAEGRTLRERARKGIGVGTGTLNVASDEGKFVIVNALDEGNKGTLNIEQLAKLMDAKIDLMETIETPVEAINVIMEDSEFPPVILADNIVSYLNGRGVSADGISLSNVESIATTFAGQNLTKAELVNIMAFFHQQLVDEITYASKDSFISKATERAREIINKEGGLNMTEALSLLESGLGSSPSEVAKKVLYKRNSASDFYSVSNRDESPKRFGLFNAKRGVLRFNLEKPFFVSQADWDSWVNDRLGRTKYLKKEKGGNYYLVDDLLSGQDMRTTGNNTGNLEIAAQNLNKRLARKLVLLKPFLDGMTEYMKSDEFNALQSNVKRNALFSLLDDVYKDSIQINPFSESSKEQSRNEVRRLQSNDDAFGSSAFSDLVLKTLYPDETGSLDARAKYERPSSKFGTQLLARNVIGTSADANSILFNTRSVLAHAVGLTADRHLGFRSPRDPDMAVVGSNFGISQHMLAYYNDDFFGQVVGVPYDLSQLYNNHVVLSGYLQKWSEYLMSEAKTIDLSDSLSIDAKKLIVEKVHALSVLAGELEMRHMLSVQTISPRLLPIATPINKRGKKLQEAYYGTNYENDQVYKEAFSLDASVVSATNGYVSKAGEVVITDSRLAQSLASSQVGKIESVPVPVKQSEAPADLVNKAERIGAMIHFEDMKLRDYLFGIVYGEGRQLKDGNTVVKKLLAIRNSVALDENGAPKHQPQKRDKSMAMWNGTHALHSSLYMAATINGIDKTALTHAVSNSPLLVDILQNHNKYAIPFDAQTVNTALTPFILMAMAEKQAYIYQGKVVEGDFLNPSQRQTFNEIVSGQSNEPLSRFYALLADWQKQHILGFFNNNNVVHTFDNLVGAMSAQMIIERIKMAEPESIASLDALFANSGGFARSMENALSTYLAHDAFWWETGVKGGAPFLDTSEGNYGINRMHDNVTLYFASVTGSQNVTNDAFVKYVKALDSVPAYDHVETTNAGGLTIPYTEASGDVLRGAGRRFVFNQNVKAAETLDLIKQSGFFGSGTPFTNLGEQLNAGNERIFPKESGVVSSRFILDDRKNYDAFVNGSLQYQLRPSDKGGIASQILAGRGELTKSGVSAITDGTTNGVDFKNRKFSKRGIGLSSAFMRKQMVDGIIREARRAKKESAVIEPARHKLSGRIKPNFQLMAAEADASKQQYLNELGIYGATSISPTSYSITNGLYDVESNRLPQIVAPFGHKPSYGFAFKKLSDGSTVVNVTGDHFAHKYMLRASRKGAFQNKTYFGFNLQEGLGYNPNNGLMTPTAFQGVGMGFRREGIEGIPDAVMAYAQFGGPAWLEEIAKVADYTLANGISESRAENAVIGGAGDVMLEATGEHKKAIDSGTFVGGDEKIIPAYEMARHGISHNYMSFTFPPNTPAEVIKGTLMILFASNAATEIARITGQIHGGFINTYFNSGSKYLNEAKLKYLKNGGAHSLSAEGASMTANSVNTLVKDTLVFATKQATSNKLPLQDIYAPLGVMNQSELSGHLDSLLGMIASKDHGYFLPQSEKALITSGDTKVAIESLFPNRPDLLDYAWDNSDTAGVTIVEQKDSKKKVTGYLIGYNIQTGYDEAGNKTFARRVVSARTRADAEAIKLKFTVSTSKAELAMAIERISNNSGQSIKLNALDSGNVVFAPMNNKVVSISNNGIMSFKNGNTQTVGHTDKPMSEQMAQAIANTLSQNQGLSVNLQQPTANLMVGNRNSKDLESSLRRRIQFGSGLGPIEFSSRLMNAIAYGKLKNKPEHLAYPATLTGNDWFKFFKESQVTKDELRQTGLIMLLHSNKDQQISRQELAEFVHTTYPSTYRISRHTNPIITESDAAAFRLPWGEDIATKETQVINDLSLNLIAIGGAIDSAIKPDTTPEVAAEIDLLKKSMLSAVDTLIKDANLPASIKERSTLAGVFESLKEEIDKQVTSDNQDSVINFGSKKTVRPMQLNYLYKTFMESRMESLNTMALDYFGGHDGLQIRDPYSYRLMDTYMMDPNANEKLFSKGVGTNYNPLDPIYTRNTWDLGMMLKINANNHNSYATAFGQYTSSVMQSEIMGRRTTHMFESYKKELDDRLSKTTNPEDIRRIRSIQASLDRVREVRTSINNNYNFNDAGHYSDNPTSTFQLGHLRETISIKNAELGLFTFGDKRFIGDGKLNDPVQGVQPSPEPVIVIEEIQSDTFQRYEVAAAGKQEMALPDSFEQVEGIIRAGDLKKVTEELKKLETLLQNNSDSTRGYINALVQIDGYSTKFDVIFRRNLAKSLLNPFEIYSLYNAYLTTLEDNHSPRTTEEFNRVFVNTGRTIRPSGEFAHLAETTPEIPVYELDFDALESIALKYHKEERSLYSDNSLLYKVMNLLGSETSALLAWTIKSQTPQILHGIGKADYDKTNIVGAIAPIVGMTEEVAASMGKMADTINDVVASDLVDYDAVGLKVIKWIRDRVAFLESNNGVENNTGAPLRIQHKALTALADTLEQMSRENPNTVLLPAMDVTHAYIGRRSGQIGIGGTVNESIGGYTSVTELGTKRDLRLSNGSPATTLAKSDENYAVLSTNARTALGTMVAHAVRPWAIRGSIDVLPAQIKELKAKQAELAKAVPIDPSKEGQSIINTSMPFGVEDIYKPVSLNATIIRAAARGMNSIVLSDARHMFNRGYSPNESTRNPYMILGRRRRLFQVPDGMKHLVATIAHTSMFEGTSGLYGNLMGRLKEMPDVELEQVINGTPFNHEGNSKTLYHHLGTLATQFIEQVYASGEPQSVSRFDVSGVYNPSGDVTGGFTIRQSTSDLLGNAMADENGKPINPFKADENSLIGRFAARRKREVQQAFKSIGSFALLTESGDCMGYVSNYGLPSYWLEAHFAGAERSLIDFYATDAFDVPMLDFQAATGTYNIVDAKTGKLIRATTNKEEALEVFHQNKKYRGGNGYITGFMKNWASLGGYVGTAFYAGATSSNGVGNFSNIGDAGLELLFRSPVIPRELAIPRSDVTTKPSEHKLREVSREQRQARPDKPLWANNPLNDKFRKLQYMARGLLTDQQITQYENMIATSSGTMMRFKPKFPTEAHKQAWRKRAIEGLANLMPSGTPDYRPKPTAGNLELLKRISEFRRAPIENPDDESQTAR